MPYSKNIFVTIILPAFLILAVPYFLVGGRLDFLGSMSESWIRMLGLPIFAAGVLLVLVGFVGGLVTDANPKTPSGLFRYTRNPIMLGVLLAVAAQYLLYDWKPIIAYVVALSAAADYLVRLMVEPRMVERHGAAYQAYLDAVPRWVPRRPTLSL